MAFLIPGVLPQDMLETVQAQLDRLVWRDGKETAGRFAKAQKNNEQADLSTREGAKLKDLLNSAILSDATLQRVSFPNAMSKILVSRTNTGGHYDWHTDDALMQGKGRKVRSDLSFTLFLSALDSYDGGELEIHAQGGVDAHKYAAGDMLVYPSSKLHRVTRVERGRRIVCVGWIESLIRHENHREMLFDLLNLRDTLAKTYAPGSAEILTLSKTISNLIRAWSET